MLSLIIFLGLLFSICLCSVVNVEVDGHFDDLNLQQKEILARFRNYVRINTAQPTPDYYSAVEYLKKIMDSMGMDTYVMELAEGKPQIVGCWKVPVNADQWRYPPFDASMDENGDIYGRGTQDMKSVGMAYLEAIRLLIEDKHLNQRNIYVVFTVDEEIGSDDGFKMLIKTPFFNKMNAGIVLDEGIPTSSEDKLVIYNGERNPIWVEWITRGVGGHGSQFIPDTATSKMTKFMQFLFEFRDEQEKILNENDEVTIGDVISMNVDVMKAGLLINEEGTDFEFHPNVIPKSAHIWTDFRHPPTISPPEMLEMFDRWCEQQFKGLELEYKLFQYKPVNPVSDTTDPLAKKLMKAVLDLGFDVEMGGTLPFATDSRFVRELGTNAFGMSPMFGTKMLLHDKNEHINKDSYMKMIYVYRNVIKELSLF